MSLRLYFSNHIEHLADKLSKNLNLENQSNKHPFTGASLIVPNMNLSKWLRLHISFLEGIFMNVDFDYMESGLWKMLKAMDTTHAPVEMADIELHKLLIFSILKNDDLTTDSMRPVAHYLLDKGIKSRDTFEIKAWQLSEQLARLFQEYEYHRVDMIRKWRKKPVLHDDMEWCQCALYLKLQEAKALFGQQKQAAVYSLFDYAAHLCFENKKREPAGAGKKNIHFFGLSLVSDFHLMLMSELKHHYNLFIYAFNPTKEFWEDVRTPGEKKWIRKKNQQQFKIDVLEIQSGDLFEKEADALLSVLGKPGRESVRLLCRLADYDFEACFPEEVVPDTVLKKIHYNLLTFGSDARNAIHLEQDRSLQIIAQPSRKREVETLLNSIMFNLDADPDLLLTDIAVLVPEMELYRPVFDSVFNQDWVNIRYNIVDANAKTESAYGKAVLSLMDLGNGLFSRKKLFDLMLNPCFMKKWNIDHDTVGIWVNWAEKLNIYHGFTTKEQEDADSPGFSPHTWKQGLERVLMSRIMTLTENDDENGENHFKGRIPFADVHTGDDRIIEGFCTAVYTLDMAAKQISTPFASALDWKKKLAFLCNRLFEIPDSLKGEAKIRESIFSAMDCLAQYDAINESAAIGQGMVKAYINSHLSSIHGGYGDYLTGGVTISALMPMRPIPFKMVYVLGMEEGGFPGRTESSTLDLRLKKRRIGDASLLEINRYLFLELLLSVKEKLYISYISKDLQKDRDLMPCSVVSQLKHYVEQAVLNGKTPFKIYKVPLKGSDLNYYKLNEKPAWSDVNINHGVSHKMVALKKHGLWDVFIKNASKSDILRAEKLNPDLMAHDRGIADTAPIDEPVFLNIWQLRKYLLDPVRSRLETGNQVVEDIQSIETISDAEDEPFSADYPADYILKTRPIETWINAMVFDPQKKDGSSTLASCFDSAYDHLYRKGDTSTGVYAQFDRGKLKKQCLNLADYAADAIESMAGAKRKYAGILAGDATGYDKAFWHDHCLLRFESLALEIESEKSASPSFSTTLELSGQLPWVWEDQQDRLNCLVITGVKKRKNEPDRYVLGPVLIYLMLLSSRSSCNWLDKRLFTLHVVYENGVKTHTYLFDEQTARHYLQELATDFLNPSDTLWLPFHVAISRLVKPHKDRGDEFNSYDPLTYKEQMEQAMADSEDRIYKLAKARVDSTIFDKARMRFGIFFNERTEGPE